MPILISLRKDLEFYSIRTQASIIKAWKAIELARAQSKVFEPSSSLSRLDWFAAKVLTVLWWSQIKRRKNENEIWKWGVAIEKYRPPPVFHLFWFNGLSSTSPDFYSINPFFLYILSTKLHSVFKPTLFFLSISILRFQFQFQFHFKRLVLLNPFQFQFFWFYS